MEHEYSVLGGPNRASIGRYVMAASVIVAGLVSTLVGLVVAVLAESGLGIPPVVLWPVTSGAIYMGLYYLFEAYAWKMPKLSAVLRVPDLSGKWKCEGSSLNQGEGVPVTVWRAEVTIVQSWDKIRIRLKTAQSGSNSIAAALMYDKADGYRVLYNYKNEPGINESHLAAHRGFAELVFAPDLRSAQGDYFNGHGRYTFGTMTLTRVES
ncbi:hypothetical protein [Xanthomonas campestris]|uniref:Cap15 family cyclic dinucleotide receptor domain-containing protein n=1 Tax=Xanthomonas campestris TaxID=339 RepID=UPI00226A5833|nr:hypothetical protein [Xanthomonas campestris]MDO0791312.1 hypothetical protein [Xanthomonas campestris pv. campestris]MDO0840198.1 hypothetical protein [Xanthomonas campestris pv. campestris]MEA9729188.1 hypothetical protein [Xanthomonas campestris pv. raphani]MEB1349850.1 hypothetical protein [Xanthomonas campestris pv. campestris]